MENINNVSTELMMIRYLRMKENSQKANKKYRETHKDKMNEIAHNYYNRNKETIRIKCLSYYHNKKNKPISSVELNNNYNTSIKV